jgi:hypothetical protein
MAGRGARVTDVEIAAWLILAVFSFAVASILNALKQPKP